MKIPKLPKLLDRKIYKTGQTRGADDDEIYQNRVSRTSTVLIPYKYLENCLPEECTDSAPYENGFIALLTPEEYFENPTISEDLKNKGLTLGRNALVFYETRSQWLKNNPENLGWNAANQRTGDLGGFYVARISATTSSENGEKIVRGFSSTTNKGAGIRVYEYAPTEAIKACRIQLETLFWLCFDSHQVAIDNGMSAEDANARKQHILNLANENGLLDSDKLKTSRIINKEQETICPLCLDRLSSKGFFSKVEQAEGRLVLDLTITQLNLFHINELRVGKLNHVPYNLGWGHHHCNVVVKDSGINETIIWMRQVLQRNEDYGYLADENSGK